MVLFTKSCDLWRGEIITALPSSGVSQILQSNDHRSIETLIWQRVEQNVIDNAEHHAGRTDAKGKGENRDEGETAILAKTSESAAKVADNIVDVGYPTRIADFLLDAFDTTKLDKSVAPSFFDRHAAGEVL